LGREGKDFMARKRKALRKIDYKSPEYWNRLLASEGLSMERGTSRRVTYVGGTQTLDAISGHQIMGTNPGQSRAKDVTYNDPEDGN
jgi:hypothetical protein